MKWDVQFVYKERALAALANNFRLEQPLDLGTINELQAALTPEESARATDSLAIMRMRALISKGQPLQAYRIFIAALKEDPLNLSLQLEYVSCLGSVVEQLRIILSDDPNHPMIELLYDVLYREAYLNNDLQMQYMAYLIAQDRFRNALNLAIPLVELYPAMLGLRDLVEQIAIRTPDPILTAYLRKSPSKISRTTITTARNPQEVLSLKKKFIELQNQVHSPEPDFSAEATFNEILGDLSDETSIDISLKDFYYLRAKFEGNKGNNWTAIQLLQSLVEIDRCNLYYRRSLEVEVHRFCAKDETNVDPRTVYTALREIAVVPYEFIKKCALAHVKDGTVSEAKRLMNTLLRLNPLDNDYLLAALEVAVESHDTAWVDEIHSAITSVLKDRPWDLGLGTLRT